MMAAADPSKRNSFVEAADEIDRLTRERDAARGGIRDCYNWLNSWNPDAAKNMLKPYPWLKDEPCNP
jgi:hypothetical protein